MKCQLDRYSDWEALAGIDELQVEISPVYIASVAYFRPKSHNGTLVVFQNGYASNYHHQFRHIEKLIGEGCTVSALNHPGYGDNFCQVNTERDKWCRVGWGRYEVPLRMHVHFSPVVVAINHGLKEGRFNHVAMIGFSAGGWLTSVMAAIDHRLELSIPVAGFMPPYLQREGEQPPNQTYKQLFEAASMQDQFVMGAVGKNRRQVQMFNKYDRCCYIGERATLYENGIKDAVHAGGGGFRCAN